MTIISLWETSDDRNEWLQIGNGVSTLSSGVTRTRRLLTFSIILRSQRSKFKLRRELLRYAHTNTRELSGEKFVTASLIIPLIEGCIFALNALAPKTEVGSSLQKIYETEIIPQQFIYMYEKSYLLMATALDPRFKLKGIERESHKVLARQYLENELDAILHNCSSSDNASSPGPSTATPSTSSIWQRLNRIRHEHNISASLNQPPSESLTFILSCIWRTEKSIQYFGGRKRHL